MPERILYQEKRNYDNYYSIHIQVIFATCSLIFLISLNIYGILKNINNINSVILGIILGFLLMVLFMIFKRYQMDLSIFLPLTISNLYLYLPYSIEGVQFRIEWSKIKDIYLFKIKNKLQAIIIITENKKKFSIITKEHLSSSDKIINLITELSHKNFKIINEFGFNEITSQYLSAF